MYNIGRWKKFRMVTSTSEIKETYPVEKLLETAFRGQERVEASAVLHGNPEMKVIDFPSCAGEDSKRYMALVLPFKG